MTALKSLKNRYEPWKDLHNEIDDLETLHELAMEAGDEEWLTSEKVRAHKLQGYMLEDKGVASMMDANYSKSLFLPVSTLKSGGFSSGSKVLSKEAFSQLRNYGMKLMKDSGRRIMGGDISLSPRVRGKSCSCDYCSFRSVCRFDPLVEGHDYSFLSKLSDDEALRRINSALDRAEQ